VTRNADVSEPQSTTSGWVSLFSGGKDSTYALYRGRKRGLNIKRLVTVLPEGESYLYQRPTPAVPAKAAESIGIEHETVALPTPDGDPGVADRGDFEIKPLEKAIARIAGETPISGVIAGAIESTYQRDRIAGVCDRLGLELYAPLWDESTEAIAEGLLEAGFAITIVEVAAGGLDRSWLGRQLDRAAFEELQTLAERHGVHPLGEGGEFETVVTDGPHMQQPLELEYNTVWDGLRGRLEITDVRLSRRRGR